MKKHPVCPLHCHLAGHFSVDFWAVDLLKGGDSWTSQESTSKDASRQHSWVKNTNGVVSSLCNLPSQPSLHRQDLVTVWPTWLCTGKRNLGKVNWRYLYSQLLTECVLLSNSHAKKPHSCFWPKLPPHFQVCVCAYVSGIPWKELPKFTLRQKSLICALPLCLQFGKLWTMQSCFFFGFHFIFVEKQGSQVRGSKQLKAAPLS